MADLPPAIPTIMMGTGGRVLIRLKEVGARAAPPSTVAPAALATRPKAVEQAERGEQAEQAAVAVPPAAEERAAQVIQAAMVEGVKTLAIVVRAVPVWCLARRRAMRQCRCQQA